MQQNFIFTESYYLYYHLHYLHYITESPSTQYEEIVLCSVESTR